MMEFWLEVLPLAGLLGLAFAVGRWVEYRHFRSLRAREVTYRDMTVTNLKTVPHAETVRDAFFVEGGAVIASDYFKSFAASLRRLVGGEIRSYQTLLIRARREALLRLLEDARSRGSREVCNVRFDTSNIRGATSRNPAVSVEVFAYATAVVRHPSGPPATRVTPAPRASAGP